METINDILNFLNQMEIFNILIDEQCDTFNVFRKILIEEFENGDLDKLVELLKNLDDLYIDYLRKKIGFDKSQITTLREMIFDMYDKKICRENSMTGNLKNTFYEDKEM